MRKVPLDVRLSLDVEEEFLLKEKSKATSFSHIIHARLERLLKDTTCPESPQEISRRITKRIDVTHPLSIKLICAASSMNIQPATYIYKFVILPIVQEIKSEKDKTNK